MKQLYQVPRSGEMFVSEVPVPQAPPRFVLVRAAASLVSAGTERMAMEFAQNNLLRKALARPDLVRQVIDKAHREGLLKTIEAARRKLDEPQSLGYSCAGTVIGLGEGVTDLKLGDRVACAGAGYAVHAEVVAVPRNLVVEISVAWALSPGEREVSFEEAAFTTLGAIAMHGFRSAGSQIGENVGVIGLGLIGLITVQLANAAGCTVLGMDPDAERCALAERLGCDGTATSRKQFEELVGARTCNGGADSVIITAAASNSAPVELAGAIARPRARIVAVGNVGTTLPRKLYFDKELDFCISRSYGPGRYDPEYEEKGHDYPIEYVRWTENRNMQGFLKLLSQGKIDVAPLITHRFHIEDALKAYELVSGAAGEPFLGILMHYPDQVELTSTIPLRVKPRASREAVSHISIGVLGAGNFAAGILIPALNKVRGVTLRAICTSKGVTAKHAGQKFGFQYCTTDEKKILEDPSINAIVIATRHHLHSRQVIAALNAGKHVFVEKPLAIAEPELDEIRQALESKRSKFLMVGFNRRFAPFAQELRSFLSEAHEPIALHYRINAGYIPPEHWVHDPKQGGGRVIGEACHFIDFANWVMGNPPVSVNTLALPDIRLYRRDNAVINLSYPDGSIAVVMYLANGDRAAGKERIEAHAGGRTVILDDFWRLELVEGGQKRIRRAWLHQDKGHRRECEAFVETVRTDGFPPIPIQDALSTTAATLAAEESLRRREPVELDPRKWMLSFND